MDRYQIAALKQRTDNNEAIAEAHIDAGIYGQGWLKVDEFGNLKRIDPTLIVIHVNPEPDHV
ncbi:MAG: hypothetical protein ACRCZ6_15145 [Kluyvera sp.]|uniref:hypothetical protein n=1 Tax=Kluyvera sp. TaxID=1538228 RepID=UPI003F372175